MNQFDIFLNESAKLWKGLLQDLIVVLSLAALFDLPAHLNPANV
jgi:hypothetical protein